VPEQPYIIAHRGDRINAVENTILACELALQQGASALEIDIRQTASGEIVVFHDFSLKRMYMKQNYVGRVDLTELKTYPFIIDGVQKSQVVDTLDELLDRFKNKFPINIDAKTIHFFDFKFADQIISVIQNHNLFDTVWISCFNPFLLQILKLKSKKIRTGYLFQRMSRIHNTYDWITFTDAWHPHYQVLDDHLVNRAVRHDKQIYVWTINDVQTLQRISQYPLNGIITDEIGMVRNYLQQTSPAP